MKKEIFIMLVSIIMFISILPMNIAAMKNAEFEMNSGYGVPVKMTNTGDEPLFDIIMCKIDAQHYTNRFMMSPGMKEPLQPGESLSWRMRTRWKPFQVHNTGMNLPAIIRCTVTAKIYENGGDNTIWAEKSVDALFFFGFVKVFPEDR